MVSLVQSAACQPTCHSTSQAPAAMESKEGLDEIQEMESKKMFHLDKSTLSKVVINALKSGELYFTREGKVLLREEHEEHEEQERNKRNLYQGMQRMSFSPKSLDDVAFSPPPYETSCSSSVSSKSNSSSSYVSSDSSNNSPSIIMIPSIKWGV